jgi:lambda repressor-like predicted transcriptional regulator
MENGREITRVLNLVTDGLTSNEVTETLRSNTRRLTRIISKELGVPEECIKGSYETRYNVVRGMNNVTGQFKFTICK